MEFTVKPITRKPKLADKVKYGDWVCRISYVYPNNLNVNLATWIGNEPIEPRGIDSTVLIFADENGGFPVADLPPSLDDLKASGAVSIGLPQPPPTRPAVTISASLTLPTNSLRPHPRNQVIYGEEDVSELVEQIVNSNWIKAIVVNPDTKRIISGHRRWLAAKALGLPVVPVEYRIFKNEWDELEALLLENFSREKTPEQKVREGKVWTEIEEAKSALRQVELAGTRPNLNPDLPPNLAEGTKGETREKVAEKVDMKRSTYEKAKKVVATADALSFDGKVDQAKALLDTMNTKSVDAAHKILVETAKKAEREQRRQTLQESTENAPQTLSTYAVLYIDPPWVFEVYGGETGKGRSAESHYSTLTLEEMKALPIQKLMQEDCAVFLWTTWPTLIEAIELATAWGLTYKTCAFNWAKLNKKQTEKPFTGMGYWTRANSEPCLLFTRGNPTRQAKDVPQALLEWADETIATPIEGHSQKPCAIYERIEALLDGPYCEVFARQKREGWTSIGNEIDGRDIREVLT